MELSEQEIIRRQSLQTLRDMGINPYPSAEYVVTDSFHACVFSIIFNKPFIVLINNQRGSSRIYSLLSKFQIQDRIIHSIDELNKVRNPIEWSKVNQILENERRVISKAQRLDDDNQRRTRAFLFQGEV